LQKLILFNVYLINEFTTYIKLPTKGVIINKWIRQGVIANNPVVTIMLKYTIFDSEIKLEKVNETKNYNDNP